MLRKKCTMLGFVIFTVIVLVLSGCGGGGSSSGGGGGNGGGGSNTGGGVGGGVANFDGFLGTWVSQGLTPQVKLIVSSKLGDVQESDGGYFQYFAGSVQCDELIGTVNITEDDSNIFGNYIVANSVSVEGVNVSYLVVSVSTEDKFIDFSGSLTGTDTMVVTFSNVNLDDFSLDEDHSITFKKQ